jgi:hypothetical protein
MNKTLQDVVLLRYQYDIHSQSWELVKILASNPDTFKDILVGKENHPSFGVFIFFSSFYCFSFDYFGPFIQNLPAYHSHGCGSGMFNPDPYFYPPVSNSNKRGGGKIISTFFCSHKYDKIKKKIFLNRYRYRKKFEQRIIVLLSKKLPLSSQKMGLGSGIQWSKRHRIPDPDQQH